MAAAGFLSQAPFIFHYNRFFICQVSSGKLPWPGESEKKFSVFKSKMTHDNQWLQKVCRHCNLATYLYLKVTTRELASLSPHYSINSEHQARKSSRKYQLFKSFGSTRWENLSKVNQMRKVYALTTRPCAEMVADRDVWGSILSCFLATLTNMSRFRKKRKTINFNASIKSLSGHELSTFREFDVLSSWLFGVILNQM